jgi:hypothetical protein
LAATRNLERVGCGGLSCGREEAPDNADGRGRLVSPGKGRVTRHPQFWTSARRLGDSHCRRRFRAALFSTYCACAIALIGKLPATIADRSVLIELRRRRPDEEIETFRFDRTEHLDRLARKAARWAADNAKQVRSADPQMPDGLFNRAADNWRVLLMIADLAGGEWPERAREAAQKLSGATDANSVGADLLADIKALFEETKADCMSSLALVTKLTSDPESRWSEWTAGKPLTQKQLAGLLKPFGVISQTVQPDGAADAKGYQRAHFEDAWRRYLDPFPPSDPAKRPNADSMGTSDDFSSVLDNVGGSVEDGSKSDDLSHSHAGLDAWTDRNPPRAKERENAPALGEGGWR